MHMHFTSNEILKCVCSTDRKHCYRDRLRTAVKITRKPQIELRVPQVEESYKQKKVKKKILTIVNSAPVIFPSKRRATPRHLSQDSHHKQAERFFRLEYPASILHNHQCPGFSMKNISPEELPPVSGGISLRTNTPDIMEIFFFCFLSLSAPTATRKHSE